MESPREALGARRMKGYQTIGGLLLLLASASSLSAQSWYYSGTKSCMDFGNGLSQCFSQGVINQMSYERPRSYEDVHHAFETGQQAGEGVGVLIGTLVRVWIQHHQAVTAEANDLRGQLMSYQRAQDQIFDDQLKMEVEDEGLCVQLESLDPEHAEHWKLGASNSHEMQAQMNSLKLQTQQVEALELKVKSPKALRDTLDYPRGVKWRLDYQQKWASQVYIVHQFLVARVGIYSAHPSGVVASSPPLSATSEGGAVQSNAATVTVERTTANAEVYLDGAFVGNTPAILHPTAGNHVVRLTAGKDSWERTLAVSDGADLRLRPAL